MPAYNIVNPTSMQAGQPEDISQVLANFQALAALVNGSLDGYNISPGAALSIASLTAAGDINLGGKIIFGNDAAADLYRTGPGQLKTDGQLYTTGQVGLHWTGSQWTLMTIASPSPGILINGNANLYSSSANLLKTDGSLQAVLDIAARAGAASQVVIGADGSGRSSIRFGANADASLYYTGTNALKTDGSFTTGGQIHAAGGSANILSDTQVQTARLIASSGGGIYAYGSLELFQVGAFPPAAGGWIKMFCENPSGKLQLNVIWPSGAKSTIAAEP